MCEGNYIKLNRKMLDWEWYDDPLTFKVFLHFLITARWQDGSWHGIEVKRGEVLESLPSIAQKNGLTVQNVRTAIQHLSNTNSITIRSVGKCRIYKVSNYEKYQGQQDSQQESNRGVTGNQQESNMEVTPLKERKEREEGKKVNIYNARSAEEPTAETKPIPLKDGTEWKPTIAEYEECCKTYPNVDVMQEFNRMSIWSRDNPQKRKTRSGITRFVHSWLARAQDHPKTQQRNKSYTEQAMEHRFDAIDAWVKDRTGEENDGKGIWCTS